VRRQSESFEGGEDVRDRTNDKTFRRTQAKIFKRFLRQNPQFWSWWLFAANPSNEPLLLAA
jgi:hypothetical protein